MSGSDSVLNSLILDPFFLSPSRRNCNEKFFMKVKVGNECYLLLIPA